MRRNILTVVVFMICWAICSGDLVEDLSPNIMRSFDFYIPIAPRPRAVPRLGKQKSASNNQINKAAKIPPSQNQDAIFRPPNMGNSPSKVVHHKNHTWAGFK
ncbi:unnamed protein product [Diamesa tonsa]